MDDQRLKEMLSAWFDGELAPQEMTMVEAYIERSEEARQIVAKLEALKQLADESELNLQSDYWEQSAARIVNALGNSGREEIEPVRRSAWSEWGFKAISLAASILMLTYVGFHSEEIFDQLREKPQTESLIQEKARNDPSIQRFDPSIKKSDRKLKKFDPESTPEKLDDKGEPIRRKKRIANPTPVPKPATETDRQRVAPVPSIEPETEMIDESVTIEQPVEQDDEASQYKEERIVSKSDIRSRADVSVKMVSQSPTVGVTSLSTRPTAVTDSIETVQDQLELASDISLALEEAGERVTFYDSISGETTEEEQYRYLWDHVIVHKLTALKATSRKIYSYKGVGKSLSNGLQEESSQSDSKTEKRGIRKKKRAIERERRLVDAAFYVGSTSEKSGDYEQALRYLRFMATKNEEILDKVYARKKWEELAEMR